MAMMLKIPHLFPATWALSTELHSSCAIPIVAPEAACSSRTGGSALNNCCNLLFLFFPILNPVLNAYISTHRLGGAPCYMSIHPLAVCSAANGPWYSWPPMTTSRALYAAFIAGPSWRRKLPARERMQGCVLKYPQCCSQIINVSTALLLSMRNLSEVEINIVATSIYRKTALSFSILLMWEKYHRFEPCAAGWYCSMQNTH